MKTKITKERIINTLRMYRGNISAVARYLKVSSSYIRWELEENFEIRQVRDDELRKISEGFYE